jgi:hypothetical protein
MLLLTAEKTVSEYTNAHMQNLPINSLYIFSQQKNLLCLKDMLHNLSFIYYKMQFIT